MRIALLARNPDLYSHRRLMEAATARGHEIEHISTLKCYMNITSHRPELRYQGRKLVGFDAVIPRVGASIPRARWRRWLGARAGRRPRGRPIR